MDIRELTPEAAVAPQLEPDDMAALAALGFVTVIDNRPDHEIPAELRASEMRRAAETAGLTFVEIPAESRALSADTVAAQDRAFSESPGPVLAYCASGTRSCILWALSQAGHLPTDEILARAAHAGYQLDGLRDQIDAFAATRG